VCVCLLVCVEKEENKHWDNQRECVCAWSVCVCDSPYLCLGIGYRETSFWFDLLVEISIPRLSDCGRRR
jgi:hypothetical protein